MSPLQVLNIREIMKWLKSSKTASGLHRPHKTANSVKPSLEVSLIKKSTTP